MELGDRRTRGETEEAYQHGCHRYMRPGGGDEGRGQADLPGDVYGLSRAHNLQALTRLCSRHSELVDRITASPARSSRALP